MFLSKVRSLLFCIIGLSLYDKCIVSLFLAYNPFIKRSNICFMGPGERVRLFGAFKFCVNLIIKERNISEWSLVSIVGPLGELHQHCHKSRRGLSVKRSKKLWTVQVTFLKCLPTARSTQFPFSSYRPGKNKTFTNLQTYDCWADL